MLHPGLKKVSRRIYSTSTMSEIKHRLAGRGGPTEDGILERIERMAARTRTRNTPVRLGIGDDAAIFKATTGREVILTCDWFLEDSHFLRDRHPPDAVGWKCLARAVSDIAAMGGVPRCILLSLALPATHTGLWLDRFLAGLQRAVRQFACPLAGGDTTRNDKILINITVIGEVRAENAIMRSGACPGDLLFATGRLGEAELGLELLRKTRGPVSSRDPHLKKHLYPHPRVALGRWLAEKHLASAMMDLSDGLSTDLPRLCEASRVGARIAASKIPAVLLPERLRGRTRDPLDLALHGGDDYELLFTVTRKNAQAVPRSFHGVPISEFGEITKKPGLVLIDSAGRISPLPNRGWDPFRGSRQR